MMMRPRFLIGDSRAERGPMIIRGVSEFKISSQIRWRSASVCLEWMRIISSLKVFLKISTSWEVRAISGTSRMVDWLFLRAALVSSR